MSENTMFSMFSMFSTTQRTAPGTKFPLFPEAPWERAAESL